MKKNLSIRKDWDLIETLIEDNSYILDIGCGSGGLIKQLEKNKNDQNNESEYESWTP